MTRELKQAAQSRTTSSAAAKIVGAVVIAMVLGLVGLGWWCRLQLEAMAATGEPVIVEVERGQGASAVARRLEAAGLVRSAPAFEIYLAYSGMGRRLKAGHFELSPTMSGPELAAKIASGEVARRKLTVPEGLQLEQIAERVAEAGLAGAEEFLAAAVPESLVGEVSFEPPAESLEGYLLPETYEFTFEATPSDIVRRMARELDAQFVGPNAEAIAGSKLSLHEIITLASLVEREAKVAGDRPKIAGVLINRLAQGMKLQCDATVQYALGEHKARLTFADLKVDSPYNTYLHAGLPPGPIAAPGIASLRAALRPAKTDALFYVARPDGSHVFTRTYEEHLAAIERIRGD